MNPFYAIHSHSPLKGGNPVVDDVEMRLVEVTGIIPPMLQSHHRSLQAVPSRGFGHCSCTKSPALHKSGLQKSRRHLRVSRGGCYFNQRCRR